MKAKELIQIIEQKFPKENAENWDNVGLLIGDFEKKIKKIQFSIDATFSAIDKAIENNIDMIITHHPIIFKAINSIKEQEVIGKKIRKLIKNDINVYSIHTNLDSTIGGLNDYVLEKLGQRNSKILDFNKENNCGIGRIYSLEEEKELIDYVKEIKNSLKIDTLKVITKNINKKIKKIALINGSAMSYWREAKDKKIDLFITGDITYHNALDALEAGLNIIDFGHYESEYFFYEILEKFLKEKFVSENIEVLIYNEGPIFKTL